MSLLDCAHTNHMTMSAQPLVSIGFSRTCPLLDVGDARASESVQVQVQLSSSTPLAWTSRGSSCKDEQDCE